MLARQTPPDLGMLNTWLVSQGHEEATSQEWRAFENYASFDDFEPAEFERDEFVNIFFEWRESDAYEEYAQIMHEDHQRGILASNVHLRLSRASLPPVGDVRASRKSYPTSEAMPPTQYLC